MKDSRIYINIFSSSGKCLLRGKIRRIGHFGIIQDFTIELSGGQEILIDQDAVDIIAKEWIRLQKENEEE